MATQLVLYDATEADQILSAWQIKVKYDNGTDTVTFKDVSALNDTTGTDAIGTYIGTLTDGTYTNCYILCQLTDTGSTGQMNYDTFAAIRAKMITASQGTLIASGTSPGTGATTAKVNLLPADQQANDYYNDMIAVLTVNPVTATPKGIIDYVNSSNLAEFGGAALSGATDNTTVYNIYDVSSTIQFFYSDTVGTVAGNTTFDSDGKGLSLQVFESLWSNLDDPLIVHYTSLKNLARDAGTATAGAAGTITIAGTATAYSRVPDASRANDIFNDEYIYLIQSIGGSETGANQYRTVSDYVLSTEVVSVSTNWTTNPDNTSVYRIVQDENEVFYDAYLDYYIYTYLRDITDNDQYDIVKKLMNNNGQINTQPSGAPDQDVDFLRNTVVAAGKAIFDFATI